MPSSTDQDYLWIAVGDIHDETDRFAKIPELSQADGIIVTGTLHTDSRQVTPGDGFIAWPISWPGVALACAAGTSSPMSASRRRPARVCCCKPVWRMTAAENMRRA